MFLRRYLRHCAFALLALAAAVPLTAPVTAQQAGMPPQTKPPSVQAPPPKASTGTPAAPGKHRPPRPAANAAPGGGPGLVWVNLSSSKYHCFGGRYYGRTANGRYMTEAAAKNAGAKGSGGKTCSAK